MNLLAAQQIQRRLTTGMEETFVVAGPEVITADDVGQGVTVLGCQGAGGQAYVVDTRCGDLGSTHPECLFEQGANTGGQRFRQRRIAPAVPGHWRGQMIHGVSLYHGLQYYRCCHSVRLSQWMRATGF